MGGIVRTIRTHLSPVCVLWKILFTIVMILQVCGMKMMTMKIMIKCPYCGSEEYEIYNTCGGNGRAISEMCVCFECDKTFRVIYAPDCIEKES